MKLSTGREINEAFVGIGKDANGDVNLPHEYLNLSPPLTKEEYKEICDIMIENWIYFRNALSVGKLK